MTSNDIFQNAVQASKASGYDVLAKELERVRGERAELILALQCAETAIYHPVDEWKGQLETSALRVVDAVLKKVGAR